MSFCSTFFYTFRYFEPALAQNFPHRVCRAAALPEQYVEGIGRCAGGDDDGPLVPVQRTGETFRSVLYQTVDQPVEQHLEPSRYVSPVAWCAQCDGIRLSQFAQDAQGIVIGQYARALRPAGHAPLARLHLQVGNIQKDGRNAPRQGFALDGVQHPCDNPVLSRTSVKYQQLHFRCARPGFTSGSWLHNKPFASPCPGRKASVRFRP